MNEEKERLSTKEFKDICRNEFSYLIDNFEFHEDDSLLSPYDNEFQIKFRRQDFVVIVEGIHYGSAAMVTLEDTKDRRISVEQLNPEFEPLKRKKSTARRPGQIEDIKRGARLLYQYGLELLKGDFSVFEQAIHKEAVAWNEYEDRRSFGVAEQEAVASFKKQEWQKVVDALEPYEEKISKRMKRKLIFAREQLLTTKRGE